MEVVSAPPITAWESGRFKRRAGPRQLLFGQMYEDAEIERRAFPPGGRIFCIASAGCTAMKLARDHEVVAVDVNPVQIAYVKRRLAGGAIERGRAERLLFALRALGPLAGWNREIVRTFLDLDDVGEQMRYWSNHLNTSRFRGALSVLFSHFALRAAYSDALLERLPSRFGMVLRARLERGFGLHRNRSNPYARALFLGELPSPGRQAGDASIELACADAATYLERQPAGGFTGFSLSNVLDGANQAYAQRLFAAVRHAAAPGAVIVLRSFRESIDHARMNHASEDRSMLWGAVDVIPASAP